MRRGYGLALLAAFGLLLANAFLGCEAFQGKGWRGSIPPAHRPLGARSNQSTRIGFPRGPR